MAIVIKFTFQGMTADKYGEALKRLEAAGASAPPGRSYHVSYGAKDNLQVIDVWDSPQTFEAFGKTLVPILQSLGVKAEPVIAEVNRIQER